MVFPDPAQLGFDFQSQAGNGASEWMILPEIIGLRRLEHIAPPKTAAALLP
jgi:hypothetical protein